MTHAKADARSGWNAVERLAKLGDIQSARWLAALLSEPSVAAACDALAETTGTSGGLRLAHESAEELIYQNPALAAIEARLSRGPRIR